MKDVSRRRFLKSGLAAGAGISVLSTMGQSSEKGENMEDIKYKVGMGQILVEGGAVDANMARAVRMIEKAAQEGCKIVVLPECLDMGWTFPGARKLAQPVPGDISDALAASARKNGIYTVAGITERDGEKLYNAAVLLSPAGELLIKHRKINELTIAHDVYSIGDRLSVVHTPDGTMAIDICADNFPTSLAIAHTMGRMGAQILLSPSAWAVPAEHDNMKEPYGDMWRKSLSEIARLYEMPVVSVSNVGWIKGGPWDGRKCIGCSMAVSSKGEILAECPYGVDAETLRCVDVAILPRKVKGTAIAEALTSKGYEGP